MNDAMVANIRRVLDQHGDLTIEADSLRTDDDLFNAGMKSFAVVDVVLAIEDVFSVTFPDEMLKPELFRSIDRIAETIQSLPLKADAPASKAAG